MHVPTGAQQEPVGCWHGSGSQTPNIVQVPVQAVCTATAQVPSAAQQEPVGCWHGFGVQTPPLDQVPLQAACVVTVHVPARTQHAPVGVDVVGLSSPPHPAKTITGIAARITSLRIVNPPSCRLPSRGRSRTPSPAPALLRHQPVSRDRQRPAVLRDRPGPVARSAGRSAGLQFPGHGISSSSSWSLRRS